MILPLGDPRLRMRSAPVSFVKRSLSDSDIERMMSAFSSFRREYGFGRAMAAPQIGIQQRAIVIDVHGLPSLLVNPEIRLDSQRTMTLWDDCMCFPDLLVRVSRAATVDLSYFDVEGLEHTIESLSPDIAELLQHEVDHLDGILAVDRAISAEDFVSRRAFESDRDYFMGLVTLNAFQRPESPRTALNES